MEMLINRFPMSRFFKNFFFCALIVSSGFLLVFDAQAVRPLIAEQGGADLALPAPSVDVSKVGYAACRGLVCSGGKMFAVWLAGSNPAGAVVLLVGIAGGQVGGRGFDAVARYLESQDITPPTEAEINELMDEFVEIDEEPIVEIEEDENGEMVALDENGMPVELELLPVDQEPEALTYGQWFRRMAYNALDTGYQGAVGVVNQLPRMGAATLTGTFAGTIGQMVGGNVLATALNAGANNLAGQLYDEIEVVVLEGQAEAPVEAQQPVLDNTGEAFDDPDFEVVREEQAYFYQGETLVIIEEYNPNPAEVVNLMDDFGWVNVQGALQPGVAQGSVLF